MENCHWSCNNYFPPWVYNFILSDFITKLNPWSENHRPLLKLETYCPCSSSTLNSKIQSRFLFRSFGCSNSRILIFCPKFTGKDSILFQVKAKHHNHQWLWNEIKCRKTQSNLDKNGHLPVLKKFVNDNSILFLTTFAVSFELVQYPCRWINKIEIEETVYGGGLFEETLYRRGLFEETLYRGGQTKDLLL